MHWEIKGIDKTFKRKDILEEYIIKNRINSGIAIKYSKDGSILSRYSFSLIPKGTTASGFEKKPEISFKQIKGKDWVDTWLDFFEKQRIK